MSPCDQRRRVVFAETLEKIHTAATAAEVRRLAAGGLRRLRRVPGLNGSPLPAMLGESRDLRISALATAKTIPHDGVLRDFLALKSNGLTHRECEVIGWIAHGKRDAEIAGILGVSKKTVGKHIEHLFAKLHVETRTAAVSVAYERARRVGGTRRRD